MSTAPTALAPIETRGDYLDGRFVSSAGAGDELEIRSPADLDDVVSRHSVSPGHVDEAVAAARAAAPGFRRLPVATRTAMLRRYQDALRNRRARLANVIAREAGKCLWEAEAEVDAAIAKIDITLEDGDGEGAARLYPSAPGRVEPRPVGVLAVIGPFNFPAHLPNGQLVPALWTGNTVVFKPSERTPTAGMILAECIDEAGFPPGAFQLVQGGRSTAAALAAHDDLDGVLFTGSYAVGRAISVANAHRPERLLALELGGKNPAFVAADADLELAARALAFGACATSGQRCSATAQVYVARPIADALVGRLRALFDAIAVGHVLDPACFMGPVIAGEAKTRVEQSLARALAAGFTPLARSLEPQVPQRGHYLRPSLHLAPSVAAEVEGYTDTELFGPDLAIYVVDDLDEGVAREARSRYGLVASVFTASRARFDALAAELDVGSVHWNRSTAGASSRLPFGGRRHSGNHRPGASMMIRVCVDPQARFEAPAGPRALGTWPGFPAAEA